MKITARIVYGLQFLIHVAEEGSINYVQIRDVVKKESISEKYLESSAYGGYKLSKDASRIFLREIFDTLEGLELIPDNLQKPLTSDTVAVKAIRELIFLFQEEVVQILSGKTLQDILEMKRKHASFDDYQI